jgi:ABC-type multidrug transport system fused ATPase/permease subunit
VFAGYRLIPAFQQIYNAFTQINFINPSLNNLYSDLENLKIPEKNQDQGILSLKKEILLKNINYNYPNSSRTTLKHINLTIPVKTTLGIIGTTGSGKTTLVDIILGLLDAQKGTLEVDGKIINKHNLRSWQRSIGYVPQHIFIADDTITSNIAFGLNPNEINQVMIEKAAKIANLHNFVIDELPKKYQTIVGERGIRLSGGQRQRIGIARALYHNPNVLIFDEATSSLDNETEKAVMDAVNKLSDDATIILIAHRLTTVKNCDQIIEIEKGKLINKGTFKELVEKMVIL